MQLANFAAQICAPAVAALTQPAPIVEFAVVALPSDGLTRARPQIALSTFVVFPGPQLEALMRTAAFVGTEHLYDI